MCKRYGVLPSRYMEYDLEFSAATCFEFDRTVARFGQWVEGRAHQTTKGKNRQPLYPTMADLLGITQEEQESTEEEQQKKSARQYLDDYIAAVQHGDPLPDPEDYAMDEEEEGEDFLDEEEEEGE